MAKSYNGPLYGQFPGSITRWMAIPWQTDTASCRSGYDTEYDPYLPTFWPARVPNQVLSKENYDKVMNDSLPREERLAAYHQRADWDRTLGADHNKQLARMVTDFDQMGIVEVQPGLSGDPDFPPQMQVEDRGGRDMTPEERHDTDKGMRKLLIAQRRGR